MRLPTPETSPKGTPGWYSRIIRGTNPLGFSGSSCGRS